MTSSTEKQIIAKLILLNISRGKCSQTMKLSQLLEQNIETFFSKSHAKMGQGDQFQTSLFSEKRR